MEKTGMNMRGVKLENRSLVLYLLNEQGAISRKDIAKKTSLTPAAVTKICVELIDEGLVSEIGEVHSTDVRAGRKEILLKLRLDDKIIFGINAETDAITYSLSSLDGKNLCIKTDDYSEDVNEVIENSKAFLNNCGVDKKKICGAGICVVGLGGKKDFDVWKEKDLKDRFQNAFEMPCVIENNVKAFAQSELIYGKAKGVQSMLFLKWGPGIGSSIVADGRVFSGNDSGVAEIGHYIVNPAGRKCRCGRYGCLETEASCAEIKKETGVNKNIQDIVMSQDMEVVSIIDQKIDLVALALSNTATILNAQSIVLFGSMFYNNAIAQKLRRQCLRYNGNISENAIVLSDLNNKSGYIGPCAVCAKEFVFEKKL